MSTSGFTVSRYCQTYQRVVWVEILRDISTSHCDTYRRKTCQRVASLSRDTARHIKIWVAILRDISTSLVECVNESCQHIKESSHMNASCLYSLVILWNNMNASRCITQNAFIRDVSHRIERRIHIDAFIRDVSHRIMCLSLSLSLSLFCEIHPRAMSNVSMDDVNISMRHVTNMNASCHRAMSHIWMSHRIRMSHGVTVSRFSKTCQWGMSHAWTSHVTWMSESSHTNESWLHSLEIL